MMRQRVPPSRDNPTNGLIDICDYNFGKIHEIIFILFEIHGPLHIDLRTCQKTLHANSCCYREACVVQLLSRTTMAIRWMDEGRIWCNFFCGGVASEQSTNHGNHAERNIVVIHEPPWYDGHNG